MDEPGTLLGGLTAGEFLTRYWQKQPLLVRGAVADLAFPFGRNEATAAACDPSVPSRLVIAPRAGQGWTTRRGPLGEEALAGLPADGWTVLFNEMDRRSDPLAALLERFRFVPNWRIDDAMVSYATDGGGVGPHIDRYDVFLLQAHGQRRWRIGATAVAEERLVRNSAHPVLERFEPAAEHLLGPGDLLYLPPRIAHEGTAVGECVTVSIGFRAPDPRELHAGFLRQLGPTAFDAVRYTDPDLTPPAAPGEIPADARRRLRESATTLFTRPGEFDVWVGRFVTTPARGPIEAGRPLGGSDLQRLLEGGGRLERSAPPHFAWYGDDAAVRLFVGGEAYRLDAGREGLAELLCGRQPLDGGSLGPYLRDEQALAVVCDVVLRGFLRPV